MLDLLTRAVVVSVHGHKQLSTAPIGIHLRATQPQDSDKTAAQLPFTLLYIANVVLFVPALLYVSQSPAAPMMIYPGTTKQKKHQRSVTP